MRIKLQAIALCLVLPGIVGCAYFGDSKPAPEVGPAPVGKLTTECARLQPLFGPSDQELTREAMDNGLKGELTKWDKNGDGELTNAEVGPLNDSLREENVGASPVTDWNGDGHVDFQEFASGWRTMFELCDRNRSKTVSLRELGHSPHVTPGIAAPAAPKKQPENTGERTRAGGGY